MRSATHDLGVTRVFWKLMNRKLSLIRYIDVEDIVIRKRL